jgi:hypothetical protein
MGPYFVFVQVQPCVDGGWIDQSFLDKQTLKGLYSQRGIGGDFLARMVVIVGHARLPNETRFFPSDCLRPNEILGMSASTSENLKQVR